MQTKHILWAVLVAAIWGVSFVVVRIGLDHFPPILLNALRFGATGILFAPFIARPNIHFGYVVGVGLSLGVAKFSFVFTGIYLGMPPGLTSVVLQSQAFFTILIAALVLRERPMPTQILGMLIAFCGIAILAFDQGESSNLTAFSYVIIAAMCWGVSNIIMKQSHADNMLGLIVWASLVATLPLIGLSYYIEGPARIVQALSHVNSGAIGTVAFLSIVATLIGFGLWGKLLKLYPASLVAPFSLLVPAFGMSSAALFLGERLSSTAIAGSMLIVIGLVVNVGLIKLRSSDRLRP